MTVISKLFQSANQCYFNVESMSRHWIYGRISGSSEQVLCKTYRFCQARMRVTFPYHADNLLSGLYPQVLEPYNELVWRIENSRYLLPPA